LSLDYVKSACFSYFSLPEVMISMIGNNNPMPLASTYISIHIIYIIIYVYIYNYMYIYIIICIYIYIYIKYVSPLKSPVSLKVSIKSHAPVGQIVSCIPFGAQLQTKVQGSPFLTFASWVDGGVLETVKLQLGRCNNCW